MTDADLIYRALLRSEQRLEIALSTFPVERREPDMRREDVHLRASMLALQIVREEIGNGMAGEGR